MEGPVEIVPGVYGLGSELVNWYLVETDGKLTAVDAGLPGFADTLEADLAQIGHKPGDIEALVLTHSDSDHTGIALDLREAGARVLIHSDDEATLAQPRPKTGDASPIHLLPYLLHPNTYRLLVHFGRRGGLKQPKVEGAETFADGDVLDVPGSPRVIHTPGHTVGHCAIHFQSAGALFAGDALCTLNAITRATGPRLMPRALNVSNQQTADSLARLEPVEAEVVLPGHGRPWHGSPAHAVARVRETL
jgi:glyoxylase-like metal-dependent hydrolase (beta-lactamase superfamily II)